MHLTYYDLTIPLLAKNLKNVQSVLAKGWEAAQASQMSETAFLDQRLAEDMFPLIKQIQMLTDTAKATPARLTGREMITLEDTETTVGELNQRIDTVLAHLETYSPEDFSESAERKIELKFLEGQFQYGKDYLMDFALPNFFFHCTVAYAIIRVQGVQIGKIDYIGSLSLHPLT